MCRVCRRPPGVSPLTELFRAAASRIQSGHLRCSGWVVLVGGVGSNDSSDAAEPSPEAAEEALAAIRELFGQEWELLEEDQHPDEPTT